MEPTHPKGMAAVAATLLLLPAVHPLLIPLVGVPSHLLWFVHVLPVALLTYRYGKKGAAPTLLASAALVVLGERAFGAGYGVPAGWDTAASLLVATAFTNLLVGAFALYARTVTARYRLLFQRVTLGIVRTDARGLILETNPAAREILGCDEDVLRGQNLVDLIAAPRTDSVEELADRGGWTGRIEVHATDRRRTLHAFVAAIRHPADAGYQILLADRSMEVLQEQEIQRQAKLATLGEALAGVAHELKNPLTAIVGHAQLGLLAQDDPEEMTEALEVVG